jgi:predicted dehydrogenase
LASRVIVAGLGSRGRDWLRELKGDGAFELVGCVDVDGDALNRAASLSSVPPRRCFKDLGEALRSVECDAVIIATPADSHADDCEAALSHGRAVLVEKPFTTRLSDAVRLVSLAEQKGVPLLVAQNYRYMRAFRAARRLVSEGVLGRVGAIVCQYYRVPHRMAPSLASTEHSALWGVGVHHLDALRHVLGRRVARVAAESYTQPWGELPRGGSLRALLTFEDGARAFYSATYESSGHDYFEGGQEFYARVVGERATLHLFHRWLVLCARGRWPRLVRRGARAETEERTLLRQLSAALDSGAEPEVSGRDNLQTMAVTEACLRSADGGVWVSPQELLRESAGFRDDGV